MDCRPNPAKTTREGSLSAAVATLRRPGAPDGVWNRDSECIPPAAYGRAASIFICLFGMQNPDSPHRFVLPVSGGGIYPSKELRR